MESKYRNPLVIRQFYNTRTVGVAGNHVENGKKDEEEDAKAATVFG